MRKRVICGTAAAATVIGVLLWRWWKSMNAADLKAQAEQMALKAQSDLLGSEITMYFSFGSYNLGTAFAQSGCTFSNFDPASVWIK